MDFSKFFLKNKIKELNEDNSKLLNTDYEKIEEINFGLEENKLEIKDSENQSIKKISKQKKQHHDGHRSRIQEKVLNNNIETLKDYEILEALLTYAIPRIDVKPIAKDLLENFKNFKNILNSDTKKLTSIEGIGSKTECFIKLIHEITCRILKDEFINEIMLNTPEKVINYCKMRMEGLMHEEFRVIFLNRKNKLIADEILQKGTIDKSAVFPREIVKRAIEIGAGAVILAHNHPSGDPSPSKADIDITLSIQKSLTLMEIYLYDHLIIGKNQHYSMKANNFR